MGGGGMGKRMSAAAAADLANLASLSGKYRTNMEAAAKAAERTVHLGSKGAGGRFLSNIGSGPGASQSNGGGANFGGGANRGGLTQMTPAAAVALRATQRGAPPLGGGAAIPASPGAGGTPGAPATATSSGGFGGFAKKFAIGAGAALLAGAINPAGFEQQDWLSNRAALRMNGGYDKRKAANQMYGPGGFAQNVGDNATVGSAFAPVLQRGGYTVGSAGFAGQASNIRNIASLNPMLAGQAGNVGLEAQSAQTFNTMRGAFGIETLNPGGKPKSIAEISRSLVGATTSLGNKPMNIKQVQATFGVNGRTRLNLNQAGISSDMQTSIQDYLTASANKGSYLTDKEQQSRDPKANPSSDTILGSKQTRSSAEQGVTAAMLKDYADAFRKTNDAINASLKEMTGLLRANNNLLAHLAGGAGGTLGAATGGGGGTMNTIGKVGLGVGASAIARKVSGGLGSRLVAGAAARTAAGGLAGAGAAAAGVAALPIEAILAGGFAAYEGSKGILGADRSRGVFSDRAWSTAWQHGLGGMFGYKAAKGDGPGRPASFGGAAGWGGITAGTFNGKEFGDGPGADPGSSAAQAAAQKDRGAETINALAGLMKGFGGPWNISSAKRSGRSGVTVSGNVSYHATGNAIDIVGNSPGVDTPQLLAINRYLSQYAPGLNELIYAGPGGALVKDGRRVSPSLYGQAVMDIHHNHVHVAATSGMLKNLAKKKKGGGFLNNVLGGISGAAGNIWDAGRNLFNSGRNALGFGGSKKSNGSSSSKNSNGASGAGGGIAGGMMALTSSGSTASQASLIESLLAGLAAGNSDSGMGRPVSVDRGEMPSGVLGRSAGTTRGSGSGSSSDGGPARSMPVGSALENAHTIIRVARQMGISKRGAVIGIATAEQESNLLNLHNGDRDSQGLFQQRPSQGWGTVAEVTNPAHAAHSFFERLKGLDYNHLPLTVAAQEVQRSAYPDAYAKWERTSNDIVNRDGQYGDGPGRPGAMAMGQTADVPELRQHMMRAGGAGGSVSYQGGSSVHIGKVEVHISAPQVSQAEAQRIGRMVVEQIAMQTRRKEMSR